MRVSKWWQFLDDLSLYTSNQWYENYECASNMKLWSVIRYSPLCHSKPVKFLHWTQKKMFRMFKITFSMHQKQVNLKSYLNFLIFRHMITRLTSNFERVTVSVCFDTKLSYDFRKLGRILCLFGAWQLLVIMLCCLEGKKSSMNILQNIIFCVSQKPQMIYLMITELFFFCCRNTPIFWS